MAINRSFGRKFYACRATKEVWTSGVPAAGTVDGLWRVNSPPLRWIPEYEDDLDEVGGKEELTALYEVRRRVEGDFAQSRCKPDTLALIASYAMGSSTPTDLTGAFKHEILPALASADGFVLPTMTVEDMYKSNLGYRYTGMMVDSFTLRADPGNFVDLTARLVGCGRRTKLTSDSAASEASESPMIAGDAKIWYTTDTGWTAGPTHGTEDLTGTPSEISAKVQSFEWNHNNNLPVADLYRFATGLYMGSPERERRTQTLRISIVLEDDTYLADLEAGDQVALEFDLKGAVIGATAYYYGCDLIFPQVQFDEVTVEEGDAGILVCTLNTRVMQHATFGSTRLYMWNNKAAYAG